MGSVASLYQGLTELIVTNKNEKEFKQLLQNTTGLFHKIKVLKIIGIENTGEFEHIFSHYICSFRNLEELQIENTSIVHPELLNFKFLIHLKNITIKNCSLTSIDNMDFYDLFHLQQIDMSHNQIQSLPEKLFRIHTLKTLIVSHNNICELPHYADNTSFYLFDISYNDLTYLPWWIAKMLIHMTRVYMTIRFNMEGNPFINYIPIHIKNIKNNIDWIKYIMIKMRCGYIYKCVDVCNVCFAHQHPFTKQEIILFIQNHAELKEKVKHNLISFLEISKTHHPIVNYDELVTGFMGMMMTNENTFLLLQDQINFWFLFACVHNDDVDLIDVLNYIFLVKHIYVSQGYCHDTALNQQQAILFIEKLSQTNLFNQNELPAPSISML